MTFLEGRRESILCEITNPLTNPKPVAHAVDKSLESTATWASTIIH